jgi:hypothetical protein
MLFPRLISIICHRSQMTAAPTVMKVNKPTILHPRVQARKKPVAKSHDHHSRVNSLSRGRSQWWREPGEGGERTGIAVYGT